MAVALAPIQHIEIVEDEFGSEARILGTKITVEEIVIMHLRNNSPIEWIAENFEVLDYAKVHAALAYYYDHKAEIDAEIDREQDYGDGTFLTDLIANVQSGRK